MPNSAVKFNVRKFGVNIRGPMEEHSILDARSQSSKESGNKSVTRFFFLDINVNSRVTLFGGFFSPNQKLQSVFNDVDLSLSISYYRPLCKMLFRINVCIKKERTSE